MHQKGIVHRDLKPANIGVYLDENQEIKQCKMLDCRSILFKKHLQSSEFDKLVKQDLGNYDRHRMKCTIN
jgi:serine/threonine protein kinase